MANLQRLTELQTQRVLNLLSTKFDTPEKALALGLHLGLTFKECYSNLEVSSYDDNTFEYYHQEYLVCTDSEADERWDESLENYIEECILPELPKYLQNYFDNERWKRDAEFDGRGHSLASYDGHENYESINFETYYIYRTN